MKKLDVSKFVANAKTVLSERSPEILLGIGITGMLSTTVLAVKATPKAVQLIEQTKKEERKDKLTVVETVKVAWKPYIPAISTGVFSIVCLVGSGSVNAKRNAALATAYKISETAFAEFKEKTLETVGEKKVKEIKEKITQDRVDKTVVSGNTAYVTGSGDELCMDYTTGQVFRSSKQAIEDAKNRLNEKMIKGTTYYTSLNDFYNEIGVDQIELGDLLGWNHDRDGLIDIEFEPGFSKNGELCRVMYYSVKPKYDYDKLVF